jgi:hypothetical protein
MVIFDSERCQPSTVVFRQQPRLLLADNEEPAILLGEQPFSPNFGKWGQDKKLQILSLQEINSWKSSWDNAKIEIERSIILR